MVLVLLGLVVFSVQTSRNLSQWVKENLTVTVMLSDDVSVNGAKLLCRDLYHRPYSRNIDYISKEQALKEQSEAMGSDPSEFLGVNPFPATLEPAVAFGLCQPRLVEVDCPRYAEESEDYGCGISG